MSSKSTVTILHTRVVTGTGGGPEKTILNSPRFLEPYGYRAICAYMHPPADPGTAVLKDRAAAANAPFVSIADRGPFDFRVVKQLLQLCRREKVAIWHGHDYKSNAIGLLLRPLWPMHLVSTVHGFGVHTGRTPFYNKIDRRCLRWYERVICVSADLHEDFLSAGLSAEQCVLIENAIDTVEFSRHMSTPDAKQALGIPTSRFLIGSVGRLSEEKNYLGLVEAVHRLIADGHDIGLVIAGEGPQKAELDHLIHRLGLTDRIRLLGFCSETKSVYQALDVFVLSSLREGLPNVLLEAMALEVPVLATRIAGVPRLVQHDVSGLLVDPGDVDQLATGVTRLLSCASLRQRLTNAARKTIESSYSFDVRMKKVRRVYSSVLGDACTVT